MKWVMVLAIAVGVVAGWMGLQPYVYRYRITLEITTPDGVRSGLSVVEVRTTRHTWGLPETRGVRSALRGEAVFVDMGRGRNLIALLSHGKDGNNEALYYRMPVLAFGLEKRGWEEQQAALAGPLMGRRAEVPDHLIPTLVTFTDLSDPKTAQVVDPFALEQVLGPGVKLNRVWIEMTDHKVTRGIEKKLGWWLLPGRPANIARQAWLRGNTAGPTVEPERLFVKD